ncbi:uncharacterized protein BYT42DRAFT_547066 [Radiomyces spectabilis]|uniref:uncharacterized protein n=1 Tax=Radiomyces spectabilis TaxID=64574 RepID=UPI002220D8C2|nr:uncharacterized protein BYT42DRAFT_547066 [Radiomyces spectabilis]KAI8376406.1 hypothetical protein BYT42DRAFT_547066 [Radiomyces spectabilis]
MRNDKLEHDLPQQSSDMVMVMPSETLHYFWYRVGITILTFCHVSNHHMSIFFGFGKVLESLTQICCFWSMDYGITLDVLSEHDQGGHFSIHRYPFIFVLAAVVAAGHPAL